MWEFELITLPIDGDLQSKLDALAAQGWQLASQKTYAQYIVMRQPQQQPQMAKQEGFGVMGIDESKVHLMRNGKIVLPDGRLVDPSEVGLQ